MFRGLILLLLVSCFSCGRKIIPVAFKSDAPIAVYKAYHKNNPALYVADIDFSKIENLDTKESKYILNCLGLVHNQKDIEKISDELIRKNKNPEVVKFLWSSRPIRYSHSKDRAYALFAIELNGPEKLMLLNKNITNVNAYTDHETFEHCVQLNYNEEGQKLLTDLLTISPLRGKPIAYVLDGKVRDVRRLKVPYHKHLVFYRTGTLEETEKLATDINEKLKSI